MTKTVTITNEHLGIIEEISQETYKYLRKGGFITRYEGGSIIKIGLDKSGTRLIKKKKP